MRMSLRTVLAGAALLLPAIGHCAVPVLISDFDGNGVTPGVIFNAPTNSGTTDENMVAAASDQNPAIVDDPTGAPNKVLETKFQFVETDGALRWVRFNTYGNAAAEGRNPAIDITQNLSMRVFVDQPDVTSPSPLAFALGLRETNTTAAIGANGGSSGPIEYIGATGTTSVGPQAPPQATHIITPGSWQNLVFAIPSEPVQKFTGNGILESTTGKATWESLGIWAPQGSSQPFRLYIDDIRVGDAGGAIPEPGSMALLASGLLPLLAWRRRR